MNPVVDLIPSVIAEAQSARAELALDLASQFARTPDRFDPKALERRPRWARSVLDHHRPSRSGGRRRRRESHGDDR